MTIEEQIKWAKGDRGGFSDGFHTFNELYEHRVELWIALCRSLRRDHVVWKSKIHSDGSKFDGWFVLGVNKRKGEQITYHLPMSKWDECDFVEEAQAPEFDGHTSADVLERLGRL